MGDGEGERERWRDEGVKKMREMSPLILVVTKWKGFQSSENTTCAAVISEDTKHQSFYHKK